MNKGDRSEHDLPGAVVSARLLAVSLAIILTAGAAITYQVARSSDEEMRSELLTQARTAAYSIDLANLRSLIASADDHASYLQLLYDQQRLVARADPSCRWTYLVTMRQGRMIFILDSEPPESKEKVSFGMIYGEAPPQFRDVFLSAREMALGPYTDRWGTWVSALIPLVDGNTGEVISVFGMDVDARSWNGMVAQRCIAPVAVTLLFASLLSAFFIIYRRSGEASRRIAATGESLKHALERVRMSQANFSIFFNSSPDFLFVMDREGNILQVNSTVTGRLGYSKSDLIGQPVTALFPPEIREESERMIKEMLDGDEVPYLAPLQARDGRKIMVETRVTMGEWDERPAIFGISKDVSALKLSEEKFSKAFNSSSTLMIISSVEDGRILDVNYAFSKILGFSRQEAVGRSIADLHIIDLESMEAVLKTSRKGWEPQNKNTEALARAKDGTAREGLFSSQEIVIDDKPCRLIVMTDITEIKMAQETLRAEEERTKALLKLSQMSDRSEDEISDRALEYGAALTLSRWGCLVFLNEDGTAKSRHKWPDNGSDEEASVWNEAASLRRPVISNGTRKHMAVPLLDGDSIVAVAVTAGKDGDYTEKDVIGLTILMDGMWHIVMKVQADDARRRSEARLANIIDFLPDATFAVDGDRRIVAWNRAMVEMTGYTKEMMLGKANFAYAVPFYGQPRPIGVDLTFDELSDIEKRYDYVKRKEGQIIAEVHIPALFGGKGAYLWIIAAPLYDDQGTMVGAIESIRDITERKYAEDLLRSSLEERELLLKEAHHRVKNNLQIISSLLKLQAGRVEDSQVISALTESQNRISSLALVHEKLYQSENLARINFGAYSKNLARRLVGSFGKEGVDLRLDLEDVFLDIDKAIPCGLILNELITNCMKHAFPGDRKGEIWISLKKVEGKVILVVKDDGTGLPEDLDIHRSRTLGMTLISALIRQLKGTLEVENEGGAQFQLTFEA